MEKVKFELHIVTENEQEMKELCDVIDKFRPKIMEVAE